MIARGGFFYPTLNLMMDTFSCSPFILGKMWKRLPENPEYAEMRHGDVIFNITMTSLIDVRPACGCSFFIFP